MAHAARYRYADSFNSKIFDPLEAPKADERIYSPPGKRRDQTATEMFGQTGTDDKGLRAAPKTFTPKHATDVPSHYATSLGADAGVLFSRREPLSSLAQRSKVAPTHAGDDGDDIIDHALYKQKTLASNLFGRETPDVSSEVVHDMSKRLTPSDYVWHGHPESVRSPTGDKAFTHADRAYHEKSSTVFGHRTPDSRVDAREAERLAREEETVGDRRRRAHAQYSDLFDTQAWEQQVKTVEQQQRGSAEVPRGRLDKFIDEGHCQNPRLRGQQSAQGSLRRPDAGYPRSGVPVRTKAHDLHQSRIFGREPHEVGGYPEAETPDPIVTDNSDKTKGLPPHKIHQALLRTTHRFD